MGETQLYSTDKHLSQCIHVHTVLLTSYCFVGNKFPSTVLCAASRDTSQSPQGKVGPLVHCCQICIAFLYAGVHPGPWPLGTHRQALHQHQNVLNKCPKSPDIRVITVGNELRSKFYGKYTNSIWTLAETVVTRGPCETLCIRAHG